MKSDLTCPVEIVRVTIQWETEDTNENGQILCLIDFFNLSDKVIDSIQMNIICFDAEDQRLGGRLVRAGAHGEPRENFSGAFAPEHVENVARVEAAVEKVWYQDGVIWRREERNVREYSPNALPPGRELDRLRSVAGPDAVGYAREDDTVWLCVCGRANRTSDDRCLRCGRDRAHTVKAYSFAAIDSTLGRKERMLEEKTRETLRRSSEQTVQQMKAVQKKQRKQKKRLRTVITLLAFVALLLAAARWGAPYALSLYAGDKLDRGLAADAKELYALIDRYWPDEFGAAAGMDAAEQKIIDGLMNVGTDSAYEQAAKRAEAIGDTQRAEKAIIARAKLAIAGGDTDTAEALLTPLAANEEARGTLRRMIYDVAKAAKEHLEYPTAIERFGSLGDVQDAPEQAQRCRYLLAQQAMSAGEYDEAIALYEACGAYLDAEDGAMQARYAKAAALFDAQEYEAAAKAFAELGSYEDAKQRVTDSEDAWLNADYNSARMDTELGNYAAVIDELAAYYESELPPRYAQMHDMYESACLARAQELTALGKPLDALPILKRIEGNKTAKKRMEAYVYQLIGRWKDTRGTEYVFREDGSCCIAGQEGYFGGSGYEITVGDEPYPTKGEYSVVSVRGKTVTLRGLQSGRTIRLSYLGEPTDREESADNPEN